MGNEERLSLFLKILDFDKKSDLEKHCRKITIHQEDFANFILACDFDSVPYKHKIFHVDLVPEDLTVYDKDWEGIKELKDGKSAKSIKALRKISEIFDKRRYLVGHIFYTTNLKYWHFFYFDQRDLKEYDNHWINGVHIHLINYLWPQYNASDLWNSFISGQFHPNKSIHIKFKMMRSVEELKFEDR